MIPTEIAENLWTMTYPLHVLGGNHGRVVTIIRLPDKQLVIHSTAPFAQADVEAIRALGHPGWLVEGALLHDTFAQQGQATFPTVPYLAPDGFGAAAKVTAQPLLPAPEAWRGELEVLLLEGMPRVQEHVLFHVPSSTLIVADFAFNFNYRGNWWERFLHRVLMGLKHEPDMNRIFKAFISDRAAFSRSVQKMMQWDFDRVIVGHKEVVESGGKAKIQLLLADAGIEQA